MAICGVRQLCLFLICLAPVLRYAFHFSDKYAIYSLTPFRMDLLSVGALLCLEWRSSTERIERWGYWLGAVLMAIGFGTELLLSHFGETRGSNTGIGNAMVYEGTLMICLGFTVYALGGPGVKWLSNRPIRYIGTISYSMYLVHSGVLLMTGTRFSGLKAAVIALGLTFAYSALSWSLLESRLLHRTEPQSTGLVEPDVIRAGM